MALEKLFENENLIKMILEDETDIIIATLIKMYPNKLSEYEGVYHGKCKYALLIRGDLLLMVIGTEYIDDYVLINEGNTVLLTIKNEKGEWIVVDNKYDKYGEIIEILKKYDIDIYDSIDLIYDSLYDLSDNQIKDMKTEILKIVN